MANQSIPILQRQVSVSQTSTPDFQATTQALAESQNNLSAIGAKVAQTASNTVATQLGYEQGKNPIGDLLPPITEFDKNFVDSYHAEAGATLSLEGQQLLDDAHVQMSKANRLTPELINNTHNQLQAGLNKIANRAPLAVKAKLQEQFSSQVLSQTMQYQEKMIGEQREDQKNTMINALDVATKNAFEHGMNGDVNAANAAAENVKQLARNAAANRFITPEQARVAHESAVQASLNGQYSRMAMQALNQRKYAEFEKTYSETDPKKLGMTNEQWLATGQAFKQQVNFVESLRTQDENLKAQEMMNKIAAAPNLITPTEWQQFTSSVSPLKAEQVNFKYIQAMKAGQSSTLAVDNLVQNWSNPEAQAQATASTKNAGYLKQVNYTVENSARAGNPISHEEAEVQVAAAAGGTIPVFVDGIKNKLHSSNPAFIESAAQQIHLLEQMQAGHALQGLNDEDHALYTAYESMRDNRDPITAARDATTAVLNQDPEVEQANKQKWANKISKAISGSSLSPTDFALHSFDIDKQSFINPATAQVYGTDILNKYKNYYQLLNGDDNSARKLTQKYIDNNYGETGVNGGSYKTMHPIEKVLGFESNDGVPYIQQDIINQVNQKLVQIKKLYDDKQSNEYWETVPLSNRKHGIFTTTYDPIQVVRHMRTSSGTKTDKFNVVLQGNAFDNWDVAIQTNQGLRNLFQVAPYLGIISYVPNAKAIRDSYNKDHQLK